MRRRLVWKDVSDLPTRNTFFIHHRSTTLTQCSTHLNCINHPLLNTYILTTLRLNLQRASVTDSGRNNIPPQFVFHLRCKRNTLITKELSAFQKQTWHAKRKKTKKNNNSFLWVSSFTLGPPVMTHTAWDHVPNGCPGARNTKKPSSLVVWAWAGEAIGLVYIEIKAEKWETAVYILGGLFSVFPSTPRENLSPEVMKNASCNWTCETWNRALPHFSLQFKMQPL